MRIVGLTGGIGSGKTTVAKMFSTLGVPVYIADIRARELTNTSKEIKEKITRLFGKKAYQNGLLNRPFIANQVFEDPLLLEALNAIIHPAVGSDFKQWCADQHSPYVIKEAAILFESGSYKQCDEVILITADLGQRIQRIMKRDGAKQEDIMARMANQWSDEKKSELADIIIENNDLESTRAQVAVVHEQILERA